MAFRNVSAGILAAAGPVVGLALVEAGGNVDPGGTVAGTDVGASVGACAGAGVTGDAHAASAASPSTSSVPARNIWVLKVIIICSFRMGIDIFTTPPRIHAGYLRGKVNLLVSYLL